MVQNFLFPSKFEEDLIQTVDFINKESGTLSNLDMEQQYIKYLMGGDTYIFPYRIYNDDIQNEIVDKLDANKRAIFHCIYSRNNDGFVRQKHVQCLIEMGMPDLSIPYILKICDEYIVEILEMVYNYLKIRDVQKIKEVCTQNSLLMHKSYSRMVSYWNEYYRKEFPDLKKYVGYKLFVECLGLKIK